MKRLDWIFCAAALLASACSGDDGGPTWHQDVRPIVVAHCQRCHTAGGIAPFALDELAAVRRLEAPIIAAIKDRTMPPFLAQRGNTPLSFDISLTDAQIATIVDWFARGAPSGDASRPADPIKLPAGGLSSHDTQVEMRAPFAPSLSPDEYRCFVIDWPAKQVKYVTGVEVLPGNKNIDHHAAVYVVGPRQAALAEQFDADDAGDGYTCFGGAERTGYKPAGLADRFNYGFLGAWVPGAAAHEFKNGVRVEPGSKIILQMHYSTAGQKGQRDQTKLRLQTRDAVDREAFFVPWLDLRWPLGLMLIRADAQSRYKYRNTVLSAPQLELFAAGQDFSKGMLLHSALLHMHRLGRSIKVTLHRVSGEEQVLVHVPRWDFDWQREYVFAAPVVVGPGDAMTVECLFDTTAAWAKDGAGKSVNWGEGTGDEMCVAHMRISHP